jgi:hypothetical protein
MSKSISLLVLIGAVLVSGCETMPTKVVDTKHVLVAPEDALIVNCEVTPPPVKDDYLAKVPAAGPDEISKLQAEIKTLSERERKALKWGTDQTTNLLRCNTRLQGVRDFKAKSKLEIEALEKKGK